MKYSRFGYLEHLVHLSLDHQTLVRYVGKQIEGMFPDYGYGGDFEFYVDLAIQRLEYCFSSLHLKGYRASDGKPQFSHLHGDQYAVFLYFLSNTIAKENPGHPAATKTYLLNKALHAFDAFYEVELPAIFAVQHPVGTVLGRANYADYFLVYQNCTVGSSLKGDHPSFGEGVVMYGGSRVIGDTRIGDNSLVSTGAILIDMGELPSNGVLHGIYPNARYSPTKHQVIPEIFGAVLKRAA